MNQKHKRFVLHTLAAALLLAFISFTAVWASDLLIARLSPPREYTSGIPDAPSVMRALSVRCSDGDFPFKANVSANEQQAQLDSLLSFAEEYGFNTLFYEAAADAQSFYKTSLLPAARGWIGAGENAFAFFDPLDYLTNEAKQHGIRVYALIDPFELSGEADSESEFLRQNPGIVIDGKYLDVSSQVLQSLYADMTAELSSGYDIAGVVYDGIDPALYSGSGQAMKSLLEKSAQSLRDPAAQSVGAIAPASSGQALSVIGEAIAGKSVAFAVAEVSADPVAHTSELRAQLDAWSGAAQKGGASFYPSALSSESSYTSHTAENTAYLASQVKGCGGIVVESYGKLRGEKNLAASSLAAAFAQVMPDNMPDYAFPQTFSVTRPASAVTVLPSTQTYFVTGTSSPSSPVYVNGKQIQSSSSKGLWGTLVDLSYGDNSFTFTQGGSSRTVTIRRPQTKAASTISSISAGSAYPPYQELVLAGAALRLSCTAPAGGSVTAAVNGVTVTLAPSANASAGTPITYSGSLNVSSMAVDGQVRALGQVSYRLSYNGVTSVQQSAGTVYAAGQGAVPLARMKAFGSMVNRNPSDDGDYLTILRDGCTDVITQNVGSYYKLSCGGYILKGTLDIVEGAPDHVSQVRSIALQKTEKGEKLVISSSMRPAYVGKMSGSALTVTLYNQSGWQNMNLSRIKSGIWDSLTVDGGESGSATLSFKLKDGVRLLGWDVVFDGSDMAIYLKRMPELQSGAKPLEGVSIVLDPGHGGDDPGAVGVPGTTGPTESELNLANSYMLRSRLEALGATVNLAAENGNVTLNERLQTAQKYDADIFVSSHHNSLAESTDANVVSGIEVYFWNDQSKKFADNIAANLSRQTGRNLRFTNQSWYRVTMMTACPAVLVESGYLCNPVEYERLADDYAMYRYGNAVADAVLQYLS